MTTDAMTAGAATATADGDRSRSARRGRRGGRRRSAPPPSDLGRALMRAAGLHRADGAAFLRAARGASAGAGYVRPDGWGFRLQAKRAGRELGRIDRCIDRRLARVWAEAAGDRDAVAATAVELGQADLAVALIERRLARLAKTHRGVARRVRVRGNPGKAIAAAVAQAKQIRFWVDRMGVEAAQAEADARAAMSAADLAAEAERGRAAVAEMHRERAEMERAIAAAAPPPKPDGFSVRMLPPRAGPEPARPDAPLAGLRPGPRTAQASRPRRRRPRGRARRGRTPYHSGKERRGWTPASDWCRASEGRHDERTGHRGGSSGSARPYGRARIETARTDRWRSPDASSARPYGRARIETRTRCRRTSRPAPAGSARPYGRARIETSRCCVPVRSRGS